MSHPPLYRPPYLPPYTPLEVGSLVIPASKQTHEDYQPLPLSIQGDS